MNKALFDQFDSSYTTNDLKNIVLFFYPKDNTPGCTKEMVAFNEHKDAFEKLGFKVIGISKDSMSSHKSVTDKFSLSISLISDENKEWISFFDVYKEKKNYGKTYMGVVRTTLLFDEKGDTVKRWNNVKVEGHVETVLEFIKERVS